MRMNLIPLACLGIFGASASVPPVRNVSASSPPHIATTSTRGMVASDQRLAAQVGADVLARGGNAVDAAVAVGYALAVVDPCCGNIGGGGFMLVHLANGKETFFNFRERAPRGATKTMYLDGTGKVKAGASTLGYLSVAVPGTVAGLERARVEYGTQSRAALLAPAIKLAQDGFLLSPGDVALLTAGQPQFAADPVASSIFLKNAKAYAVGDRLVQPDLAMTLERIARKGRDGFYRGSTADALVAASATHGGILTKTDLTEYTAEESAPVHCTYRGYDVASAPPPSSGGTTLCETLNIVAPYPLTTSGFASAAAVHVTVEAERRAYADRNTYLGDPDFVKNPLAQLLSPSYASILRSSITASATPSKDVHPGAGILREGETTTHYSVVDKHGNAVAVTYTINSYFGAGVVAPGTGFLLNNEMDDFAIKPGVPNQYGLVQGSANAIAPGKRPLSSMAPTILSKDGKVFLVVGSPGGSRIITITLGVIQNVLDYGMNVQDAVDAPRMHHQWLPDTIQLEPHALTPAVRAQLSAMHYTLVDIPVPWGAAEAVLVDPVTGLLSGANDRRRPAGGAVAP